MLARYSTELLLLILLVASGSVVADSGALWLKAVLQIVLLLLVVLAILPNGRRYALTEVHRSTLMRACFTLLFLSGLSLLNGGGLSADEVSLLGKCAIAALVAWAVLPNLNATLHSYVNLIRMVCVASLIVHCVTFAVPSVLIDLPQSLFQGKEVATAFGFNYYHKINGVARNQAFFWEPGVFSFFINLAIVIEYRYRATPRPLFLLALISTFSLGGWLLCMAGYGLSRLTLRSERKILILILSLIPPVMVGWGQLFPLIGHFTEWVIGRNLALDPSYAARSVDFYFPFIVALQKPYLGHGLNEMAAYIEATQVTGVTNQLIITNFLSMLAYSYGIMAVGLFLYLLATSSFVKAIGVRYLPLLILLLAHEPLGFSAFLLVLLFAPPLAYNAPDRSKVGKNDQAPLVLSHHGHER